MAYCTISDVNALVPQSPYTATTAPTQAQVEGYISQISNRIDATLYNLGYVTPVTASATPQTGPPYIPDPLSVVKEACAWGSLGLASQSRITSVSPDSAVGLSVWTKMFNDWIKALLDPKNPFELPNAQRNARQIVKPQGEMQASMISNSVDSGTATSPSNYLTAPTFYMGKIF